MMPLLMRFSGGFDLSLQAGFGRFCEVLYDLSHCFCLYRLHGNVESLAVLSHRREECRRRRDAIVLAFRDAKIAVLEFDDSTHGLRAR